MFCLTAVLRSDRKDFLSFFSDSLSNSRSKLRGIRSLLRFKSAENQIKASEKKGYHGGH